MRLLIDESLSQRVAVRLSEAGHDVCHLADLDLLGARDETVLAAARRDGRALASADTDFGTLLALSGASQPSVILLRRADRRAERRAAAIHSAIEAVGEDLTRGALVVVEPDRLRLRRLPIGGE